MRHSFVCGLHENDAYVVRTRVVSVYYSSIIIIDDVVYTGGYILKNPYAYELVLEGGIWGLRDGHQGYEACKWDEDINVELKELFRGLEILGWRVRIGILGIEVFYWKNRGRA